MTILLGPILSLRGIAAGQWAVSALVVTKPTDAAPAMTAAVGGSAIQVGSTDLGAYPADAPVLRAWRFDVRVPMTNADRTVEYTVDGSTRTFHVPASGDIPQSLYVSCNGFSSLKLLNQTADPNRLWRAVAARHGERPFNFLLMGGDQIYADSIWDVIPELHEWAALPLKARVARKYTQALARKVDRFYAELYLKRWAQPDFAGMLAQVPTVMMWDDHDIFDGWGSHREELQRCDVFKGIFASARRYFSLFQLQAIPDVERHPMSIPGQDHFSIGFQLGPLTLAAIDMRSERTATQVIGFASWKAIYDWFDALPGHDKNGAAHLFLMTSIPVIYPDFSLIEEVLGRLPGDQEIEDDLRDHWNSQPHKEERLRFIHRLLDFTVKKRCRTTLLSGDVHVGAVGVVRSTRVDADPRATLFNQLTSSGIVHPPPPGVVLFFLENVMKKEVKEDRDIFSEMTPFPGTRYHYVGARNWLALESDPDRRIWAHWNVEGADHPLTKVIHPLDFKIPAAKIPSAEDISSAADVLQGATSGG